MPEFGIKFFEYLFIADDSQVKIAWVHVEVFNEHNISHF